MSKSGRGGGGGGRGRSKSHGGGGHGGGGGKRGSARGKVDYQQRSLRRQMNSQTAAYAATVDDDVSDNERDQDPGNGNTSAGAGSGVGKQDYSQEPTLTEELHSQIFSAFNQYLLDQELNKFSSLTLDSAALALSRRFQIVRPMNAVLDVLSNPHGSVKLNQGDTCVVVGFYGPTDVRIAKELPHRGVVDVIYRPKVTGTSQLQMQQHEKDVTIQEERTIEAIITNIFETVLYLDDEPAGTGFNVIIQEYENDGCLLSSCINAANIAILDGCASMRNTVASVTAVVTNPNPSRNPNSKAEPQLIIDPNADQLKKGFLSQFVFAFTNNGQLVYSKVIGRHITRKLYKWVLDQCLKAAQEIFAYYEYIMKRKRGIAFDDDDTPLLRDVDPEMEVISSDEDEVLVQEMKHKEPAVASTPAASTRASKQKGNKMPPPTKTTPAAAPIMAAPPGRQAKGSKTPQPPKPVPVIDVEDLSSDDSQRELEDGEID